MPNVEKTPRQTIRVERELWEKAGAAVGARNRGAVIRDFLRWLTYETDSLPARPTQSDLGQSANSPQDDQ